MRHFIPAFLLLFASLVVFSLPGAQAQCEAGEVAIEFVIDTDSWGYELYGSSHLPRGIGGENFIASGGNSANVGCDGVGTGGNGTTYGNNAIYTEGPFCAAEGGG